jgi:cell division GTPase FtsZ
VYAQRISTKEAQVRYQVRVQVKGGKSDVYGPAVGREDAEQDIAEIKRSMGSSDVPDVAWLAITADNIASADILEYGP